MQLAVGIGTLVRKAHSPNIHDYKLTKMTEIAMMTLTPQLQKNEIDSHPSLNRISDQNKFSNPKHL